MIAETALKPLVTIIIPYYNREILLPKTLSSVMRQTYANWECLLVDDGSTDASSAIVEKYCQEDNRFKGLMRPKNLPKGANACRNYGFSKSNGIFINWFDSDDLMHEAFIETKVKAFTSGTDGVVSRTVFFSETLGNFLGEEGRTRPSNDLLQDFITLKRSWYLPDCMWRKSFLENKMLFDENLHKGQDRNFHIRMLLDSPNLKFIEDCLTYYRLHPNSISKTSSSTVIYSYFNAINRLVDRLQKENKLSSNIKEFYFITQVKNYPHLYKEKGILKKYKRILKVLFVPNIAMIIWAIRFLLAVFAFNLIGKGTFLVR